MKKKEKKKKKKKNNVMDLTIFLQLMKYLFYWVIWLSFGSISTNIIDHINSCEKNYVIDYILAIKDVPR